MGDDSGGISISRGPYSSCTPFPGMAAEDSSAAPGLVFPASAAAALEGYLPPTAPSTARARPFVTLTYACSLDGGLALAAGVRTPLSGAETKAMTHFLRSRHAAILVGVATLLADDAALNCRLAGAAAQPQPVIVDPHLRWTPRPEDRLLQACRRGAGRPPLVLTARPPVDDAGARVLAAHGGRRIHLPASPSGPGGRLRFSWHRLLEALAAEGLASVMVEGGAQVMDQLLAPACHDLVDSVVLTIAPTWLGRDSVAVRPDPVSDAQGRPVPVARLADPTWHPMGHDVVLCARMQPVSDAGI